MRPPPIVSTSVAASRDLRVRLGVLRVEKAVTAAPQNTASAVRMRQAASAMVDSVKHGERNVTMFTVH